MYDNIDDVDELSVFERYGLRLSKAADDVYCVSDRLCDLADNEELVTYGSKLRNELKSLREQSRQAYYNCYNIGLEFKGLNKLIQRERAKLRRKTFVSGFMCGMFFVVIPSIVICFSN